LFPNPNFFVPFGLPKALNACPAQAFKNRKAKEPQNRTRQASRRSVSAFKPGTGHAARQGWGTQLQQAVTLELAEQNWPLKTEGFKEGIQAMTERRPPQFQAR